MHVCAREWTYMPLMECRFAGDRYTAGHPARTCVDKKGKMTKPQMQSRKGHIVVQLFKHVRHTNITVRKWAALLHLKLPGACFMVSSAHCLHWNKFKLFYLCSLMFMCRKCLILFCNQTSTESKTNIVEVAASAGTSASGGQIVEALSTVFFLWFVIFLFGLVSQK